MLTMLDTTVGAMFVYNDKIIRKPKLTNPFTQAQMYYPPHLFKERLQEQTSKPIQRLFKLCITAGWQYAASLPR